MSVGAPTWRGLKRSATAPLGARPDVSRCPDMEGIETGHSSSLKTLSIMSVGAPTWRGLKLGRTGLVEGLHQNVSRCPDMEGIETPLRGRFELKAQCQ